MEATVNFCAFFTESVHIKIKRNNNKTEAEADLTPPDDVWDAWVYLKNAWDVYLLINWQGKSLLI